MQFVRRWPYGLAVVVSVLIGVAAVVGSLSLGVPLEDPAGFLGPAYIRLPLLAVLIFGLGLLPPAIRRRGWRKIPTGMVEVLKYEWTARRTLYIATGFGTFYVCYVAYRNLKNILPIYRQGVLYDQELFQLDRWMFGGTSPAVILHDLFGVDLTAGVLSFVYLAYLPLVPITLGALLVLHRDLAVGAWYATTLSLNWVLGTLSYYVLPALGPIYARPDLYVSLPETGVSSLQQSLLDNRLEFLANPSTGETIQGVAAFASLHVSITFAAALFLQRTIQRRLVRSLGWTFFALTFLATLYFGWHYLLDNVTGMIIGWVALEVSAWATGCAGIRRSRAERAGAVGPQEDGQFSPKPATRQVA